MSNVVIYNVGATPQDVTNYIVGANTPDYNTRPDALINPDVSAVAGLLTIYWKVVGTSVIPMTAQEQANVDAAIAAATLAGQRSDAIVIVDSLAGIGKLERATADVLIAEINFLRQWITSFKAATAAATSLANFQSRVATLADAPDRTLTQGKNAIKADVAGGTVDS